MAKIQQILNNRQAPSEISPNLSKEEELLVRAYHDSLLFGKLFLPDFRQGIPSPKSHKVVMAAFDSDSNKPIALIAHRDFAKTTLVKAKIIQRLCYAAKAEEWGIGKRRYEFIGWSSSNRSKSENNTRYVSTMLEKNPRILRYFGNLRGKRWSTRTIETIYGDSMISTSNLSSLRGDTIADVQRGAIRYSLIIADDSENELNTITPDSRRKFSDLIIKGMLPAIDSTVPGNKFVFINTPVHYAGFTQNMIELYHKLKENPELQAVTEWIVLFFPAIIRVDSFEGYSKHEIVDSDILPAGVYNWPERINKKYLERAYRRAKDSPSGVAGFYQEYMLEVQSEEDAKFGRQYVKYHDGALIVKDSQTYLRLNGEDRIVNTFIGCDPATDINTSRSDYSVVLVIAIDADWNIYVLHYERHRSIPTLALRDDKGTIVGKFGVVDYLYKLYDENLCKAAKVEDVAMTRSVWKDLEQWRLLNNDRKRRVFVRVRPAGQQKINRIYTVLNSHFSAGKIYIRRNHSALEDEIITFGEKMAHDDTIESLAFAVMFAYPPGNDDRQKVVKEKRQRRKHKAWYLL